MNAFVIAVSSAINSTHVLLERWAFNIKKYGEKKVASTFCKSEKSDVCMFAIDFLRVWADECSSHEKPSEFRGREIGFLQKPISSARVSGICGYHPPLLVSRKKTAGKMGKNWCLWATRVHASCARVRVLMSARACDFSVGRSNFRCRV